MTQTRPLLLCLALLALLISGCQSAPATEVPPADAPAAAAEEADHPEEAPHAEEEDHAEEAASDLPALAALPLAEGERLQVVATTSIVGDVVAQVGGDAIELTVLMEPGQDPHSYEISAQELAQVAGAHLIFINGLGLEEGLAETIDEAAAAPIVPVSAGIEGLASEEAGHEEEGEADHDHGEQDPHVWFDPHYVEQWTVTIEQTLAALDPAHAERYGANAAAYRAELEALDETLHERFAAIPAERRKLVTNHDTFQYFARAYDFEVVGTVIPSFNTGESPAAADLSALIEAIRAAGVPALFVENTLAPGLAEVVVEETGAQLYPLYTDALGPVGSEADSYLGLMRANAATIEEALAP